MGPFQTPWLTFTAWIVIGASCFEYFSYMRQRSHFEYLLGEAMREVGMCCNSLYSAACVGCRAVSRIVAVEVRMTPQARSICLDELSSSKGGERTWRSVK